MGSTRGGRQGPNRCMRCLEEGHHARHCTNERNCYVCRQKGHEGRDCPKRKATSTSAGPGRLNKPAPKETPTMSNLGSTKRQRDPGPSSGYTPETKQAKVDSSAKPKFSYAQAARGTVSLVLFHKDRKPVTVAERKQLEEAFNAWLVREAAREGDPWLPEIVSWRAMRLLGRQVLAIDVKDGQTATWFTSWVGKLVPAEGNTALSIDTMDNLKRMDLKRLTGFARGTTGQMATEEALLLLLKLSARRREVTGTIELARVVATPTGAVIHIDVDGEALSKLAAINFTLNVGFAGEVKFNEVARKASSIRLEAEKEELARKLEKVTQQIEERSAQESAEALSGLSVGGGEEEEGDVEEEEMEESQGGDVLGGAAAVAEPTGGEDASGDEPEGGNDSRAAPQLSPSGP